MRTVENTSPADLTVRFCADAQHPVDCPGEVVHVIPPGSRLTYDAAADNAPDITAQLLDATEVM